MEVRLQEEALTCVPLYANQTPERKKGGEKKRKETWNKSL